MININKSNTYKNRHAFTLVELAIVITIIGLLIGGVLKGQEILANARVTSTIAQVKAYKTAMLTFKTTYQALPGDITNPADLLPNCLVAPCMNGGNGDQIVDDKISFVGVGTFTGNNSEQRKFWLHLAVANLITGISTSTTTTTGMGSWGLQYPEAKLGGGFHIAYYSISVAPYGPTGNHYIQLQSKPGPYILSGFALTGARAMQIDLKIDDGQPYTGDVLGVPSFDDTSCVNNTTGVYNAANPNLICNMFFRMD